MKHLFAEEGEYWNVTVTEDYTETTQALVECYAHTFDGEPDLVDMTPEELEAFGLALYQAADVLRQANVR